MPKSPKLKVETIPGYPGGEVLDFEQAKDLFSSNASVFVEGYQVNSYEEFVQLAAQDSYKDRESLEVVVMTNGLVDGG